jgi:addiction module antitoxin, relB/dinJ family
MSTVTTSIKLDENIKRQAQEVAKSAGLTLSALINSYLTQVVATRHIELYAPEPMTPQLEALLTEIESSIATGDNLSKPFDSAEEFLADLKK